MNSVNLSMLFIIFQNILMGTYIAIPGIRIFFFKKPIMVNRYRISFSLTMLVSSSMMLALLTYLWIELMILDGEILRSDFVFEGWGLVYYPILLLSTLAIEFFLLRKHIGSFSILAVNTDNFDEVLQSNLKELNLPFEVAKDGYNIGQPAFEMKVKKSKYGISLSTKDDSKRYLIQGVFDSLKGYYQNHPSQVRIKSSYIYFFGGIILVGSALFNLWIMVESIKLILSFDR